MNFDRTVTDELMDIAFDIIEALRTQVFDKYGKPQIIYARIGQPVSFNMACCVEN